MPAVHSKAGLFYRKWSSPASSIKGKSRQSRRRPKVDQTTAEDIEEFDATRRKEQPSLGIHPRSFWSFHFPPNELDPKERKAPSLCLFCEARPAKTKTKNSMSTFFFSPSCLVWPWRVRQEGPRPPPPPLAGRSLLSIFFVGAVSSSVNLLTLQRNGRSVRARETREKDKRKTHSQTSFFFFFLLSCKKPIDSLSSV